MLNLTCLATCALLTGSGRAGSAPQEPASAERRPNVLVVLLDDVGFGQLSAFGGPYRTPNIDRLAQSGLRYTNFHTTALCSPTRSALLTGRNHHSVGMATITETASLAPGYHAHIPASAGTLAAILQTHGYNTYAFGKWHLTPVTDTGPRGPFDHWPTGMGFDHWYGFHGGQSDQYAPSLWQDTTPVELAKVPDYHLSADLATHAVEVIGRQAQTKKPFFVYFAPGAGHAPHQVPSPWITANRGRFDDGWDVARERILARQKALGIVPESTVLPARNAVIPAWDSLTADQQRLFARMQEVHAAFVEHADAQIGRVLNALERSGQLNNTLVILTSDNGASGEGGLEGTINDHHLPNGVHEDFASKLAKIDELGSATTCNNYPAGWAQAGNTPFRFWKQITHEGGIHDPMIVAWPAKIHDQGGIRPQFTHVTDITPTILEALAISAPAELGGVRQMPMEGTSFVPTFASAREPTAKHVQYFEMIGHRGIWMDGWKAVTFHGRLPWLQGALPLPHFEDDVWELYDTTQDPSETYDLAQLYPEKLATLKTQFALEAARHQVFPLNDTGLVIRAGVLQMRTALGVRHVEFNGPARRIPEIDAPYVKGRSHTISAELVIPQGGADGVIVAAGGSFGGYALYVKDGRLTYAHNYVGDAIYKVTTNRVLPQGVVNVVFEFHKNSSSNTAAGTDANEDGGLGRLLVNGEVMGEAHIPHTTGRLYGASDTFDIGADTGAPVVREDYATPFAFTGKINSVKFDMQGTLLPGKLLEPAAYYLGD